MEEKDTKSLCVWLLGMRCCLEMRDVREEDAWSPGGEGDHELDLRSWKKCPLSSPMCKTAKHNSSETTCSCPLSGRRVLAF